MMSKRLSETLAKVAHRTTGYKALVEQPQVAPQPPAGDEDPEAQADSQPTDDLTVDGDQQPSAEQPMAPEAGADTTDVDQPPVGGTQGDPADMPQEPTQPFQNNGRDKLNVDGTPKPSPSRYRQPGPGDQKAIQRFLKENPRATDDELHSFLRSLGIDPQEGEKVVMKLARQKAEAVIPQSARDAVQLFLAEGPCDTRAVNKPWRTPDGPKKFAVCGKDGDQTKLVRFGDPNLEIKRDDPARRKNFRARHGCDTPGPKTKAKYWACKTWESKRRVSDVVESIVGLFLHERRDQIPGGRGDKLDERDVDPEQLRMGIEVELEHTKEREIAKEIALDHLKEDPEYYTKLKKVHKDVAEADETFRRAERGRHSGDSDAHLSFHVQLRRQGPDAIKAHFQQLASKLIRAHQAHQDANARFTAHAISSNAPSPNWSAINDSQSGLTKAAEVLRNARVEFESEVDHHNRAGGGPAHPALHLHRGDDSVESHMNTLGYLHGMSRPPAVDRSRRGQHFTFIKSQNADPPFDFGGVDDLARSIRHHYKGANPDVTKTGNTALLHVRLPEAPPPLRRVRESTGSSAQIITDDAPEPSGLSGEDDDVEPKLATLLRNIDLPVVRHEDAKTGESRVSCGVFLPLPFDLARQFPKMLGGKSTDDSPPHVTVLYVGKITPAEYTGMVNVVQRVISTYQPFFIDMSGANVFDDAEDYDTLYAVVNSRTFRAFGSVVYPTIHVLHAELRKALEDAGINVEHTYGRRDGKGLPAERFTPHATIARVPKGEQCLVRPPSGSWFVLDVECWGYERVQLQLGKTAIDQPAYRGYG
jgi:2'-5' RNA ligase